MGVYGYGKKAVFLVENGFCEREFIQAHKVLSTLGYDCRIVSVRANTLVQGWKQEKGANESRWGGQYACHKSLCDALPSDYDLLVLPGGERSIQKLRLQPELKSFVSFFVKTNKPIVVYNQGIEILAQTNLLKGYAVAAKQAYFDMAKKAGARCSSSEFEVSKNIISMSRFRPVEDKIKAALCSIIEDRRYISKVVSSEDLPHCYQAA